MHDANGKTEERGFHDLPDVQQDIDLFRSKIEEYGFPETDIFEKKNATFQSLSKIFRQYERKILENAESGKKTLTIVYYGGHGVMKANHSQIILPDPSKPLYDLESRIRSLSQLDNSFVIGIFDCCREAYDESMLPPRPSRGGDEK